MTESNIPNGVSFKDLQKALEGAPTEAADTSQKKHYSFKEIERMANEAKSELFKSTQTPLALKLACLMILTDMAGWHIIVARQLGEAGDHDAEQSWLMDAGQLNLMKNSLLDIEVTDQDPTPSWKDPEDCNWD